MSDETNRIETIKVSKEFKGIMGGLWLGMEAEVVVSSDEDVINEFKKRNELLEKAYMALNPQINWNEENIGMGLPLSSGKNGSQPTIVQVEKPSGVTIEDINSCGDKVVLQSYKFLVKGKPELEAAYLTKLKELV
jgi:hypothetical protein